MKKEFIALFVLMVLILAAPVMAEDNLTHISFSDLNLITHQDIQVFGYNTTSNTWDLKGVFNTTSTGLQFEPGQYNLVIKPSAPARLFDPVLAFEDFAGFVQNNLTILIVICFLLGGIAWWRKN
jgi:hypothetical protein